MDECGHREIRKHQHKDQICREPMVLRAGFTIASHAPHALREKKRENCEEDAGDFMPERTSGVGEWVPECPAKTAAAPHYTATDVARGGACIDLRHRRTRALGGLRRRRFWRPTGRRIAGTLPQKFRSDARADAEFAA